MVRVVKVKYHLNGSNKVKEKCFTVKAINDRDVENKVYNYFNNLSTCFDLYEVSDIEIFKHIE